MSKSEAEANKRICPIMSRPADYQLCMGAACMAWEWDGDGWERRDMPRLPRAWNDTDEMHDASVAKATEPWIAAGWEVYEGSRHTDLAPQTFKGLRRRLPARLGECTALVPRAMPNWEG